MDIGAFKYQPLEQNSVRLLVLQPSQHHDACLEASLVHTTLRDLENDLIDPYTALSYVWGDVRQSGLIYLNGYRVVITQSLEAALRDIRDASRTYRLWTDLLCIDQANIPERNQQVALMCQIYRSATHTIVYLGSLSQDTEIVFAHVQQRDSLGSKRRDDIIHMAKDDILRRPWFTRVWVFQELVLSSDPRVQCGQVRIRWSELCELLLQGHQAPQITSKRNLNDGLDLLEQMNSTRLNSKSESLLDILEKRRGMRATDPRDLIYAHLGLASDQEDWSKHIEVDYTKPLSHTFCMAALYIVHKFGFDGILTHVNLAGLETQHLDLPSWVPDWREESSPEPDVSWSPSDVRARLNSYLEYSGKFCVFIQEANVLLHLGLRIGVINDPGPLCSEPQGSDTSYPSKYDYWSDDEFQSSLVQSLEGVGYSASFISRFPQWALAELGQTVGDVGGRLSLNEFPDRLLVYIFKHFVRGDSTPLQGRRLVFTQAGELAIVPHHAQRGDFLVRFAGSIGHALVRPKKIDKLEVMSQRVYDALKEAGAGLAVSDGLGYKEVPLFDPPSKAATSIYHGVIIGEAYLEARYGDWVRETNIFALY